MSGAGHALMVGATGMLAPAARELAGRGWRVSVLARRASAFASHEPVSGYDCDYYDEASFRAALARAVARDGPVGLAVAWFHDVKLAAARRLAEAVGEPGAPGRYIQVLGSAVADPARPDRLATAAAVAEGLDGRLLRQVVLGFRVEDGCARWNTNAEISAGVLAAIESDAPLATVGVTSPWSMRPGG
ncbi:hypothetical protein [Phenylobacterium sp.]|uniref:hypothetical protein n=1 Tax=Phenylobacterium sp. TaxID=1871053 RepID=UPI0035B07A6A